MGLLGNSRAVLVLYVFSFESGWNCVRMIYFIIVLAFCGKHNTDNLKWLLV